MKNPIKNRQCEKRVHSDWTSHQCDNPAKMMVDGKYFCGVHDPLKAADKQAERDKKWKADYEARKKASDERRRLEALGKDAISALKAIAAGHNDACSLARATLRKHGEPLS